MFGNKYADAAGFSMPAPLSLDRMCAALDRAEIKYERDDEASSCWGGWESAVLQFKVMGESNEISMIRGRWRGQTPLARRGEVTGLCNQWNSETIWPKAYTEVNEGDAYVFTELASDWEKGVTDDQLDQEIMCGIQTSLQFFDTIVEQIPDAAAWLPAE